MLLLSVFRRAGTVLFDIQGGSLNSRVSLAGRALVDVGVVIPRATYTNRSVLVPGVNNFGFIDSSTSLMTGSDIQGAHDFLANPASWRSFNNVHDGGLLEESFRGTTVSDASVNTILFFNNDFSTAGDTVASNSLVTNVPGAGLLQAGQLVRGNGILAGSSITSIDTASSTFTLSRAPTITDNTAPTLYAFDNAFVTGNLVAGSNLVTDINDPRLARRPDRCRGRDTGCNRSHHWHEHKQFRRHACCCPMLSLVVGNARGGCGHSCRHDHRLPSLGTTCHLVRQAYGDQLYAQFSPMVGRGS
jgi:hypothetical protein